MHQPARGDLAEARSFWERLDYEVDDIDDPWDGIAVAGLPVGCHAAADLAHPVLLYESAGAGGLPEFPHEPGITTAPPLRALGARAHRLLRFREGFAVLQLARTH